LTYSQVTLGVGTCSFNTLGVKTYSQLTLIIVENCYRSSQSKELSLVLNVEYNNHIYINFKEFVYILSRHSYQYMSKMEKELKKVNFEIYIADRKATTCISVYRQSFFCSAVLTPQHYHWYAATRFALPGG